MTERPTYIRRLDNGSLGLCSKEDAEGLAYAGQAYHLSGRPDLAGTETVVLVESDAGVEIDQASTAGNITFVKLAEAGQIDNITAGENASVFNPWAFPVKYEKDQIRRYNNALYKCVQAHTSQEDWTPDAVPALWKIISDPMEEWPAWSQPIGSFDTYSFGDKVSHKEKRWTSTVSDNVWEPGIYGWEEQNDAAE